MKNQLQYDSYRMDWDLFKVLLGLNLLLCKLLLVWVQISSAVH